MELIYTAGQEDDGLELKSITQKLQLSAAMLKRFKYHGSITKNGVPVTVRAKLCPGDVVCFSYEEIGKAPKTLPMPKVIYEDEYILALDKPAGLATHPAPKSGISLADEVIGYLGGGVFRAVNRLDKPTSGIVLAAKDPHTAQRLNNAMAQGGFEKIYHARLVCAPKEPRGEIIAPILSIPESPKRHIDPKGKYACTKYRLLTEEPSGTALVEAMPVTGRTHQIRLHMAHIGCPLYADALYGEEIENQELFLRCVCMRFVHPQKGHMILQV